MIELTFGLGEAVAAFDQTRRMRSIRRKFDMSVRRKILAGRKNGSSTFV